MAFHVRDPKTDTLVRELARERGVGLTEAVKLAVEEALRSRRQDAEAWMERVRALQDRAAAMPDAGLKADKAFYDWLNDEED